MLAIKFARLALAISVSVWMAGGCLLGCGNSQAMAAEVTATTTSATSEDSCEVTRSHGCCTKPGKTVTSRTPKKAATTRTPNVATRTHFAQEKLAAVPHGMKDCPLMMNATAITAKSSGNLPEPGRVSVAVPLSFESANNQTQVTIGASYLPNRGPTHLRCCVFLI